MHSKHSSSNLASFKPMLATRFLQALAKIKREKPSCATTIIRRSRRIKFAAEASMASTVGSKRAWSRAMLWKLQTRAKCCASIKPKISPAKRKKSLCVKPQQELSRADELRRLVPGGQAMGFCTLLDEAADYIRCLSTQVQVMQNVVDSFSV